MLRLGLQVRNEDTIRPRGAQPATLPQPVIAQLQRTIGNRATGALLRTQVQRVFDWRSLHVNERNADTAASEIYAQVTAQMQPHEIKINEEAFLEVVNQLAEYFVDYGTLSDQYFRELISKGLIEEKFTWRKNERRVETLANREATFPPTPSIFQTTLLSEGQKPDLSYADLRGIVEQILVKYKLGETDFNAAVETAVKNFNTSSETVLLDPELNADLQLLVAHLLKYQTFNLGPLPSKEENKLENEFREVELAKSKRMISNNPLANIHKIMPPTPNWATGKGENLQHAMGPLIDLNRPLSGTAFGGETYKAVFLLARKLFLDAQVRARQEFEKQLKTDVTMDEQIDEQRKQFNTSMFSLLPKMERSTIEEEKGKEYLVEHVGFPYDEEAQSFDEMSDQEEQDLKSDEEIYAPSEDVFRSAQKRSTLLSSVGLFAKVSGQKELLDKPSDVGEKKYKRQRERISRQTTKIEEKYGERLKSVKAELDYVEGKEEKILNHIEKMDEEVKLLTFFTDEGQSETGIGKLLRGVKTTDTDNPVTSAVVEFNARMKGVSANTKTYKDELRGLKKRVKKNKESDIKKRISSLRRSKKRARELHDEVGEFYFKTPVGDLLEARQSGSRWRSQFPLFAKLGDKSMRRYIYREGEEERPAKRRRRSSPERRRRKSESKRR